MRTFLVYTDNTHGDYGILVSYPPKEEGEAIHYITYISCLGGMNKLTAFEVCRLLNTAERS